jgi:hypothetical protein
MARRKAKPPMPARHWAALWQVPEPKSDRNKIEFCASVRF